MNLKNNILEYFFIFAFVFALFTLFIEQFSIFVAIICLGVIILMYYVEEIRDPKTTVRRKEKIFQLLKQKYHQGEVLNNEYLKIQYKSHTIIFHYSTFRVRGGLGLENILKIYIDITYLDKEILDLCKIHFYCETIKNIDYLYERVSSGLWSNSLKLLSKNSEKTIDEAIDKLEKYVESKKKRIEKRKIINSF